MCGIVGYISSDIRKVPESARATMRAAIMYRGRDAQGEWNDGQHVCLLHSRLSIIDLTAGQQPMWDGSRRYVIICNGEIYNYKELRAEYTRHGAEFRTQSDTEVILEGFKLKGERVCQDLNGMFAFAIWDTQTQRLFLARDRVGKKPLVWCVIGGVFYFASTLDAFRSIPGWSGEISHGAVELYRMIGGFPLDLTAYIQARALPPASFEWVGVDNLTPQISRYWQMDFSRKSKQAFPELLDEYEQLLTDAISIRLRSDVTVAITFSGGVDSGTIAALCAQKLDAPLACYTIDYHTAADPSPETVIAERVARELALHWKHIQFDYHNDLLADLPRAYSFYDQPCIQLALVYSQSLYEKIRPFAKVVLSGNGADELFTGYIGDEAVRRQDLERNACLPFLHRTLRLKKPADALPSLWGKNMQAALSTRISTSESYDVVDAAVNRIASAMTQAGVDSYLDQMMYLNLLSSTSDSNYRLPDISGLAAQVEVRSPYLDYRMVEFAARLPHQFKVGDPSTPGSSKYLPKVFYEKQLGKEIAWSRKKGMGFNLRWDRSIAKDTSFRVTFERAYAALDKAGIETTLFREAWQEYTTDKLAGTEYPATAGEMMAGFMLGMWINRVPPANALLAKSSTKNAYRI
jgi:asparagine synthase (glutamine-hydrolysing)